jgi:ABC-type sugar transport system permease subunit
VTSRAWSGFFRRRDRTRPRNRLESRSLYLLFVPVCLFLLVFKVVPLIVGVMTSLTTPVGVLDSRFVGLENYQRMLSDGAWLAAVGNAVKLMLTLPLFVLVPLLVATLLFNAVPGWRRFRAVYFLSWLLPPISVGFMFNPVFGTGGPVNALLSLLGIDPVLWLGSPTLTPIVLVLVILWSWFGLGTAIFLAGYSTMPLDLVDAARIDGASGWSILRWVAIPHLMPTIASWSILCTASLLLGLFPLVYALTEGGPGTATLLPEYYIWSTTLRWNPGYTSALGITLFAAVVVLSAIQVRVMYHRTRDE